MNPGSPLDGLNLEAIDRALDLDEDTRAVRNRMLATLSTVQTAEQLWDLYRSTALPPGAPLIQVIETRRAVFWAFAAAAAIAQDPERMRRILNDLQDFGMRELQGRVSS